jgi:hypothetical protein
MRVPSRCFGARARTAGVAVLLPMAVATMGACGGSRSQFGSTGGGGAGSGGGGTAAGGGASGGGGLVIGGGASSSSSGAGGGGALPNAIGAVTVPDCAGCTFPPSGAAACAASAPRIELVYPADTVLVPPNLAVISVMWKVAGAAFQRFEVDFSSPPNTDWRVVTSCKTPTQDVQGTPSGGCELPLSPASWSALAAANRGGNPVAVTVRGTTDGSCATSSNTVHMSFAEEDLLGTYFYWKSTISSNGVGGQIWSKVFGDLGTPEKDVTSKSINATCNGCHALSRDGSRMVVYSDDDDSDDEYSDVAGSYLDMTTSPNATEFPGGVIAGGHGGGGQPPGFSTIHPNATHYVTSNGYPCTNAGGICGSAAGYATAVPANGLSVWNGQNGTFLSGVTVGADGTRPTMPDWSVDGKSIVYVEPAGEFGWRDDDAHVYGGSLYTVPYLGNGAFGPAAALIQSAGENNYYPSYSPEMSYVLFNRVPLTGAGADCAGGFCANDSFSNPAARLLVVDPSGTGGSPIDLEMANGSPAASPIPTSNSYPRWAPFVQTYRGGKLLWFTFSSTRDYGLRVLNHKPGMYQCYPADAAETAGASHHASFATQCQIPQLWMASINLSEAQGKKDPSRVAFWIPYQDITTHNHTAQWTAQATTRTPPGSTCTCVPTGQTGCAGSACGCCDHSAVCDATGTCRGTLQ